jgi:hypothetical protein
MLNDHPHLGDPFLSINHRTTLSGVFAVIPAPSANVLPSFSATVTYAPAAFNLSDVWMDVDTGGEGALVSCVRA